MLIRKDLQRGPSIMLLIMKLVMIIMHLFSKKQKIPYYVPKLRKKLDASAERFLKRPKAVNYEPYDLDGMLCEWIRPTGSDPKKVLYYLHGGAYAICSLKTHRRLIANIARQAGTEAFAIEYRMAPENPYPAAVDDAVKGYQYLLDQGYEPKHIVIAGDSAGGGLTAVTMLKLRELGLPQPAAGVLLSPWADLEGIGESNIKYDVRSSVINNPALIFHGQIYAGDHDLRDPYISPIYADFTGVAPMYIVASRHELIYDDSTRLAAKADKDGVVVTFDTYPHVMHVWQTFDMLLPEARQSIKEIGNYIKAQLG